MGITKQKRVYTMTLGCKVNQYDTGAMEALLEESGHRIVVTPWDADVILINSCTVTAESDRKTRQAVRRMVREYPHALLIVAGCSVQRDGKGYLSMEGVDVVLGSRHRSMVITGVEESEKGKKRNLIFEGTEDTYEELGSAVLHHTRGVIKIQDGCDRHCTYCIIPRVRGPIRSRKMEDILAEAAGMAQEGIKEIVLTGIRLLAYEGGSLLDVVEALSQMEPIGRIRLGSLDPDGMTPTFVERAASIKKLCPHFHLSLQSGSDTVLRRMGRSYDRSLLTNIAREIRKHFPRAGITADVLTGFPGEREKEYAETIAQIQSMSLSRIHVFPYSKREGTAAARMPEQLPNRVKEERTNQLIRLGRELETAFVRQHLGETCTVVFEERTTNGQMAGYAENYMRITAPYDEACLGRFIRVRMEGEKDGCGIAVVEQKK